ncbi:MAG: B-box zinc finger protein [Anaerolineales bacterium]|nr:B-box zinc finger protein [Anaerolineales bacterium]MCW5888601.1 B-box zinc finger protein [Anaerolineales bacterium]
MTTATYCANHPTRETGLRCNQCEKYICAQCAIHTPTGYRCRECVRGQQKVFDTSTPRDYVLAILVATLLSALGGYLALRIGFFTLFLAPLAGNLIAAAVRRVTGRRRSPRLFQLTALAVGLGAAPFVLLPLAYVFGGAGLGAFLSALWPLAYLSLAVSTTYYRLAGIEINS